MADQKLTALLVSNPLSTLASGDAFYVVQAAGSTPGAITAANLRLAIYTAPTASQTIIGGPAANDTLTLQANAGSSGNTATNNAIVFKTGNSGGTTAIVITQNGIVDFPGTGTNNSERIGANAVSSASSSLAVGAFTQATANNTIAIGYDAQAKAGQNTAIGYSSRAITGTAASAFGYAANANGSSASAFGSSASALASSSVAFGSAASVPATETGGVAIGTGAAITVLVTGGGENVAIGNLASVQEWRGTAIGYKATAGAISATAIGRGARAMFTHTIALGRGAWANAASRIVIGFWGGNTNSDIYFDNGDQATYTDPTDGGTVTRAPGSCPLVIHGMSGKDNSGAPVNNIAGGDIKIAAGQSTGTAAGGKVILQTAPAGGVSNNTENALVDRLIAYATGVIEVVGDTLRISTTKTPASAAATGTTGDMAWDSGFLYQCVAANTWKRVAIATW